MVGCRFFLECLFVGFDDFVFWYFNGLFIDNDGYYVWFGWFVGFLFILCVCVMLFFLLCIRFCWLFLFWFFCFWFGLVWCDFVGVFVEVVEFVCYCCVSLFGDLCYGGYVILICWGEFDFFVLLGRSGFRYGCFKEKVFCGVGYLFCCCFSCFLVFWLWIISLVIYWCIECVC